jgi:Na+/H+ antiporter NhaD/arsenite permease-like protein
MQNAIILLVFLLTYLGLAIGRLPWFRVDRTGIVLLGAIALLGTETVTLDQISGSIDVSTLVLLFALMIVSAQFLSAGFYDLCADWITSRHNGPFSLLALTVGVCGLLTALLANDIVVYAMAPLLIAGARARGYDPRPFLIGLVAAANTGSAATLISSPQNIYLGQIGNLSFHNFLLACAVPAIFGLGVVFAVIWFLWHERVIAGAPALVVSNPEVPRHPFDKAQTIKALVALVALLVLFSTSLPREVGGLVIAALLLASRKITSRTIIAAVDWPLLLLFLCLFTVTGALAQSGMAYQFVSSLGDANLLPDHLAVLAPLTLFMSNLFGNVPSVVVLLQIWPNPPEGAFYGMALLFSFAGNLLLLGSFANLIVAERATQFGVHISFGEYARAGIPITIISMVFAMLWLYWTGWLHWATPILAD